MEPKNLNSFFSPASTDVAHQNIDELMAINALNNFDSSGVVPSKRTLLDYLSKGQYQTSQDIPPISGEIQPILEMLTGVYSVPEGQEPTAWDAMQSIPLAGGIFKLGKGLPSMGKHLAARFGYGGVKADNVKKSLSNTIDKLYTMDYGTDVPMRELIKREGKNWHRYSRVPKSDKAAKIINTLKTQSPTLKKVLDVHEKDPWVFGVIPPTLKKSAIPTKEVAEKFIKEAETAYKFYFPDIK